MTAKRKLTVTMNLSTWQQGATAARAGYSKNSCPYYFNSFSSDPLSNNNSNAWMNGWDWARFQMRKEINDDRRGPSEPAGG